MVKLVIKVFGAVISGLNVAVPLILDAQSFFPEWNYQYHVLIGFLIFVGFMVWIVFGLYNKVTELQNTRPIPRFEVKLFNDQATLKIHNDGAPATFKATARIIDNVRQGLFYGLCLNPEPRINTNGDAQILLAEMVNGYIFLCQENERFPLLTEEAYEEYKLKKRYPNSYLEMSHGIEPPEDECTLEVIITSDPSPIEATEPKRYHLGKDDKGGLVFIEVISNSDKEDSQNESV